MTDRMYANSAPLVLPFEDQVISERRTRKRMELEESNNSTALVNWHSH